MNKTYVPKLLRKAIKQKRKNKSLRITANEIGLSAATLSRIEAGKLPSLTSYYKILRWLNR